MRRTHAVLVLLAGVLILPNLTWSQGPSRSGAPGGMPFAPPNPDEMFNRFSGGKDVIVVSELDSRQQRFFQFLGPQMGLTGDRITREQFRASQEKMNTMFQSRMGGGGPGGAPPVGGPAPAVPVLGGGSGGPPALQPPTSQGDDQRAEGFFRRSDKNSDGLLDHEEMSETLQRERDTWDKDKNGFIDLNEYKAYVTARTQRNDNPNGNEPRRPDGPPALTGDRPAPVEDKRPTVYRAGNLPKDLPDWFVKMDREGDVDGQVGLYEWRKSTRNMDEFALYDINEDGFITAEEYLRWKAKSVAKASGSQGEAIVSADRPGGERPQFGGTGQGGGGEPRRGFGSFGPGQGQGGSTPGMGQGGEQRRGFGGGERRGFGGGGNGSGDSSRRSDAVRQLFDSLPKR